MFTLINYISTEVNMHLDFCGPLKLFTDSLLNVDVDKDLHFYNRNL